MKKLYPINTVVVTTQNPDDLFEKPWLMADAESLVAYILLEEPKVFKHVFGRSLTSISQEKGQLGKFVSDFIIKHPKSPSEWIYWLMGTLLEVSGGYQHFLKSIYVTRLNGDEIVEAWTKSSVTHFNAFAKNRTTLFKDFGCDDDIDREKWAICEEVNSKQVLARENVEMLLKIHDIVEKQLKGYSIEWIDYDNGEICLLTDKGRLTNPMTFSNISCYKDLKEKEEAGEAVAFDEDMDLVIY